MANTIWSANFYGSTETAFNTWGKSVSDAFSAVGMVNSYRSRAWNVEIGNWATITNERVVEVWTFPASALPTLYMRISYGQTGVTYQPRIAVRIGNAHDGNGNVTGLGNFSNSNIIYACANDVPITNWMSSDGNGLAMILGATASNYNGNNFLIIDRYRNSTGTALGTGAMMFVGNPPNGLQSYSYDIIENDAVTVTAFAPCVTRGAINSGTPYLNAYGQTQIYPWWSAVRSGHGVSKMICTYATYDRPTGTNQSVAWLTTGTNRTIRTAGPMYSVVGTAPLDLQVSGAGVSLGIWWSD
jgi:hypothetical protein